MTIKSSLTRLTALLARNLPDASIEEIEQMIDDVTIADEPTPEPKPARTQVAPKTLKSANGKSTRRASITEIEDWYVISEASQRIGVDIFYIKGLVEKGHIDWQPFGKYTVVNVKQVLYWREHGIKLEKDLTVWDRWSSMSATERELGLSPSMIKPKVDAGLLAYHVAHPKLKLVNIDECWKEFGN